VVRIYEEGKGRALYVVADTWNLTQRENCEGITDFCPTETAGDKVPLPPTLIVKDSMKR